MEIIKKSTPFIVGRRFRRMEVDTVNTAKEYDTHRKGEANDCTVRATASVFGISYKRDHKYAATNWNRKPGEGVCHPDALFKMSKAGRILNGKKVSCVYSDLERMHFK